MMVDPEFDGRHLKFYAEVAESPSGEVRLGSVVYVRIDRHMAVEIVKNHMAWLTDEVLFHGGSDD